MQILGIDVGGSGIKAAIVETSDGSLQSERIRIETPRPATPQAIGTALRTLIAQTGWKGPVGMGFPAAIQRGIARTAANIDKSFIGLPVATYFSDQTGCPIHAVNDADAAGLAEVRFGAGRDVSGVVLVITIGTGLGTALFTDGRLLPNAELGHIKLDNGREAERYASEAVRVAKKLKWKDWSARFDHYLTALENLLWPDLIVLGGGVSKKLDKFAPMLSIKTPIVAAQFLNQAGIIGAALFAETQLRATTQSG